MSIRQDRVRAGLVDDAHTVEGADGLPIGAGDVIQTRRNDSQVGVANRQSWIVQQVDDDAGLWVRDAATDRKHRRTVHLPAAYVAQSTHLAYGVQGMTAPESHTVLSDALDAAGVYVGLTRGRETNRLHIVAADLEQARVQFTTALRRDHADRGLAGATRHARDATSGLVTDGPAREVNDERARLAQQIEHAEFQVTEWERALAAYLELANRQRGETDQQAAAIAAAQAQAQQVRAQIAAPLYAQALADGTAADAARTRVWELSRQQRAARGFRKRGATRALTAATGQRETSETATRRRWGSTPATAGGVAAWAESVTSQRAEADPRMIERREHLVQAVREQTELGARHTQQRHALDHQVFGGRAPRSPREQAAQWRRRAETARRDLAAIQALPVTDAAQLIRDHAAQKQARRDAAGRVLAERKTHGATPHDLRPARQGPTPPSQGLSL